MPVSPQSLQPGYLGKFSVAALPSAVENPLSRVFVDLGTATAPYGYFAWSDGQTWQAEMTSPSTTAGRPLLNKIAPKLRAKIAAAAFNNPVSNQPLIAPSAWVASTAYQQGQAVVNGGNCYVCGAAGTSAGSGGPTTTGAGPITDNTAAWFYAGPSFSSAANAPTSLAVTSTNYTGTYYRTTTGTYSPSGASPLIGDSTNFWTSGGTITQTGVNNGFAMAAGTQAVPSGQQMQIAFMSDAKQLQVHIAYQTSQGVTIYVDQNDGKGLCPLTLGISGVNAAQQNYYQIVWPTAKARMYVVEIGAAAAVNGMLGVLMNEATSKVWAPLDPNSFRIHLVGDSFVGGSTYYPATTSMEIQAQMAKMLGTLDYISDGESGTGYVQAASLSVIGSPQRVAFAQAMAPDVLWLSGGSNDAGTASATITAAVLACLQAYRAALPNAIIMISGCNTNNSGPSANVFACEAAIQAAVTLFNDPLTYFYSFSSTVAEKAWLSGTGTTAAPSGSGNCDIYIDSDSHPSYQGANYLGYRHANAVRTVVGAWTF